MELFLSSQPTRSRGVPQLCAVADEYVPAAASVMGLVQVLSDLLGGVAAGSETEGPLEPGFFVLGKLGFGASGLSGTVWAASGPPGREGLSGGASPVPEPIKRSNVGVGIITHKISLWSLYSDTMS